MARQRKIVLRNCGVIDPASVEEYIARGGYQGLPRALSRLHAAASDRRSARSGLRGRGGGGFSTGRKWQVARDAPGETKYLICNGDEGDPGAYMDRTVLESDPHSVIEGMIIGAYAVGAQAGLCLHPRRISTRGRAHDAGREASRRAGLAGSRTFSIQDFNFSIEIVRGAGAFVCGEETALIASIEGGLGEPRPKPPYPAVSGLWGQPTIINNVKTWATVPVIMARGATWYAALGTPHNAGTVVFSLVGQIANTGLVEVPLGLETARSDRGHRRRRDRWPIDQGRADRRAVWRLSARPIVRSPDRVRSA